MAEERPSSGAGSFGIPPLAGAEALSEQEARASGVRQESVERLARLGTWQWRPATGAMEWSAGLYRLLGRTPERQPPGYEALIGAVHPEDRGLFLLQLETALKRNTRLSIDHRVVLPDGSARAVHTEAECVDAGEAGERWLAVMQERSPSPDQQPLRRMIEALPDVFWLRALDMHETLYVSPAYEHLWGRPRPELIHEPSAFLHAVVHEDYAALQRLLECHGRGCAYEAEFRVRHPGGMVRWVRERGYPLRDERGVWAMAAVDVDITAWKQEEADRRVGIHESQGQLDNARLVLDAMPVAALRWDHQGHLLYRNRAADSLPEGQAAGLERFLSAVFPDVEARGRVRDRLHGALPAWSEFATRLRSGEERVFAWSFVPLGDDSVLAFGVDVQERRNLERRLHETEANFRSLYDSNVVPLYFWRMDGRVTGANDAWLHLLGYTREELEQGRIDWVGMTPEEFRERDRQTLHEQLAGRSVAEPFEKELLRKDGSRVPVLAGGALFPDRHGGVGFAIDLSERRQAEDRLRQLNSDLNDAIAELKARQRREIGIERLTALGTLAAGVAHELNNPLMAVMNYVDYAGRTAAKPDAAGALANAQRELERMRDLLQNMLAFAGPARERTRQVEVAQIVENALTLMRPDLNQRGIAVTVEFEPALPPVPVKELQLRQVVVNLLMNARDALEEVSDRRIRIAGHRHSGFVALQVEDTGPGIPAGIREQIFDPFFTTKPPGRGTGLGLPIARSIMLELGGDLFFDEGIQGGARFTLLIPVAEAQE